MASEEMGTVGRLDDTLKILKERRLPVGAEAITTRGCTFSCVGHSLSACGGGHRGCMQVWSHCAGSSVEA